MIYLRVQVSVMDLLAMFHSIVFPFYSFLIVCMNITLTAVDVSC